jgi:CDP-4-dehydro-6-deoxyglucose reductase
MAGDREAPVCLFERTRTNQGGERLAQWLTLSRAAHLIGIGRGALQEKIRAGDLASFDGMVSSADLCRAFPEIDLDRYFEDGGAFERIVSIKDEAFGRRVRERLLPSQEILAQRLFAQSLDLADARRYLGRYHDLIEKLQAKIDTYAATAAAPEVADIGRTLEQGLADVLGSEDKTDAFAVMDDMLRVVAARVTLRPSGREFLVEGNDSLLTAALKSGVSPAYGCGNGTCGLCKARLVSGRTRQVHPADYPLSEAEKQQGMLLMCCHTAVSDVVVEALEARVPADVPAQELVARVRSVAPLAPDTLLLHLQTPRSNRLRFLAGQCVTLGVSGELGDYGGEYPVASCPCDDRNLHFHFRRDDADDFTGRLFAGAVKPGDSIGVRGPWGDFVIDEDASRPLLFIAGETGFAPIKSLIEHALAAESAPSLTLCWSAARGGHYLSNLCRSWADALDGFRYIELDGGAAVPPALAAAGVDAAASDMFIAGPADFVDGLRTVFAGVERLRTLAV